MEWLWFFLKQYQNHLESFLKVIINSIDSYCCGDNNNNSNIGTPPPQLRLCIKYT